MINVHNQLSSRLTSLVTWQQAWYIITSYHAPKRLDLNFTNMRNLPTNHWDFTEKHGQWPWSSRDSWMSTPDQQHLVDWLGPASARTPTRFPSLGETCSGTDGGAGFWHTPWSQREPGDMVRNITGTWYLSILFGFNGNIVGHTHIYISISHTHIYLYIYMCVCNIYIYITTFIW